MTNPEDAKLLKAIAESVADPAQTVELVLAYYCDADRANRTDRSILCLHLGFLSGQIMKLLSRPPRGR